MLIAEEPGSHKSLKTLAKSPVKVAMTRTFRWDLTLLIGSLGLSMLFFMLSLLGNLS